MSFATEEIASQPSCWRRAVELAADSPGGLPEPGERLGVIGCGTSLFMAQAYAALRERSGLGECDAFAASEFPVGRRYDRVLALTRSGTTTEVLAVRFYGALQPIARAAAGVADASAVPVGLHLDHIEDDGLLREAAGTGFGSVMYDASRLP